MEIVGIVVIIGFWFLLAVAFLMLAARLVTRIVLDEIAKDRQRRG
jgi:hypothetical protein